MKASNGGGAIAERVSQIIFQFNSHCDYPPQPGRTHIRGPSPSSRNQARIITPPFPLPLSSVPHRRHPALQPCPVQYYVPFSLSAPPSNRGLSLGLPHPPRIHPLDLAHRLNRSDKAVPEYLPNRDSLRDAPCGDTSH